MISCNFNNSIFYTENNFAYPSLSDKPTSASITFYSSPMPSRKDNNFGLTYFKFSISPCHKSCQTCSTPEINACNTCADLNSILQNGKCVCKENYINDISDPLTPCIPITNIPLVISGIANPNNTDSRAILYNHIKSSTSYCNNQRPLLGGFASSKTINENNDVYINFLNYNLESNFYKVKVSLQLITDNDNSLSFPFFIYSSNDTLIKTFSLKQIKYLKLEDNPALPDCFTGISESDLYKLYNLNFYVESNTQIFYLKIINNFNKFWGVYNLDYKFMKCHQNCQKCIGYKSTDCTVCKYGMIFNDFTFNEKTKTGSCQCDKTNGFVKISNKNSTNLECLQKNTNFINEFFINDLDEEKFVPEIWNNIENILSKENFIFCENKKILGNFNLERFNYLERIIDLSENIPNFSYHNIDISFKVTFVNKKVKFGVKVFLDDFYIWGNLNTPLGIQEEIQCDKENVFYSRTLNFTYFANDYFTERDFNNNNQVLRIQVFPESECLFDSTCGWGLDNLEIKVTRNNLDKNSKCAFRPFIDCPCDSSANQCKCFPGYYSFKSKWGDYSCLSKKIKKNKKNLKKISQNLFT